MRRWCDRPRAMLGRERGRERAIDIHYVGGAFFYVHAMIEPTEHATKEDTMTYRPEHFDLDELREYVAERLRDEYDGPSDATQFAENYPSGEFADMMDEADRTLNDEAEQLQEKMLADMADTLLDALRRHDEDAVSDPYETL